MKEKVKKSYVPALMFFAVFSAIIFFGGEMTNISRSLLNASVKIQLLSVGYKAENINVNTEPPSDGERVALQPEVSSVGQSDAAVERPTDVETGEIKTVALEPSAGNSFSEGIHYNNTAGVDIDVSSLLSEGLPFKIEDSSEPQVLIYHTHGTESYSDSDSGFYVKNDDGSRSTDTSKNTVRVGDAIAEVLNNNGIVTINDRTMHDKDSYTGSYSRSEATVRQYLEKYPSIKVVIDGHRDSITQSNGTKIKPTAEINGKSAAQVMVLAGCESGDVTNYPNWMENLRFNLLLQRQLENDYPGLARAMSFKSCKYNFNIMNGSILLEIGSEANTLDEAVYSGQLIGEALVKIFKQ